MGCIHDGGLPAGPSGLILGDPTTGWKAVFYSNYTSIVRIYGSCYDMDVATDNRRDLYI